MKKIYNTKASFFSLLFFAGLAFSAQATIYPFYNAYSGAQEVPPNASPAKGTIVGTYNDVTNTINFSIIFSGLVANTNNAHFHGPAAPGVGAGVTIGHAGFPLGVTSGSYSSTAVLTDAQEAQLLAGLWYSNIHSTTFPGGELRAQITMGDPATNSVFVNAYSGTQEVPPNNSPGTGTIMGIYNHVTNTINFSLLFSGLVANTNNAHFHGPAAPGVGAGVTIGHAGFPLGVTSGFYSSTAVLTNTQEMQLLSGLWYSNIHSTSFPGGEIRAQIMVKDILAPSITNPVANPTSLWPPNNKMKDVAVVYTSTDNFPAAVNCQLSVTSNEPVTSATDKSTPDWLVVNSSMVQLRAERAGKGDGRIYTITVTCTDAQGNTSSKSTTVAVPHDNGKSTARLGTGEMQNTVRELSFKIAPNPSKNEFTINIQTENSEKINLRVFDLLGRTIELRNNLIGSQTIKLGKDLKPGVYFVQFTQGNVVKQLRLVKTD